MYSIYNYTYIYFSVFKTNILKIIRVMHIACSSRCNHLSGLASSIVL